MGLQIYSRITPPCPIASVVQLMRRCRNYRLPDSVAVGVFRRGARRWGCPRRETPEAAVQFSAILEPEGDSEPWLQLLFLYTCSFGAVRIRIDGHEKSHGARTGSNKPRFFLTDRIEC